MSLILSAATRLLVSLLLLFSIYMLVRGHNDPGGGFIGGLIASIAFALYAIAHGTAATRQALRLDPSVIAVAGLGVALASGVLAALFGDAPFTGLWLFLGATEIEKGVPISSVLLFDVGVYLVVIGAMLTLVLNLEETLEEGR